MSGFSLMLGPMGDEADEAKDPEREAAKAALNRFRDSKDPEVALEAFLSLCRYAENQGGDKGYGGGSSGGGG